MTPGVRPMHAVLLVAGRELNTRLRTRAFLISTVVSILVLGVFMLLQSGSIGGKGTSKVGLTGQATALGPQIQASVRALNSNVQIVEIADQAEGDQKVRGGNLDASVYGPVGSLSVAVKDPGKLGPELLSTLNSLVREQSLSAALASGLQDVDPRTFDYKSAMAAAAQQHVTVVPLDPKSGENGQRLGIGLVIAILLYMALMIYGQTVAQGVIEEKSSRVVEILLATLRPWQLLSGKVLGLGLVGLVQFTAIGLVGLIVGTASGVLTISGAAVGGLLTGVLWYLLGFFFYATIFAAVGSLVSRQEDAQGVLTPVLLVIVIGFIFSINLLIGNSSGTLTTVMAMLPPFAPILMPGLTALGVAPIWLQVAAILLTLGGIALVAWIGGRIYRNAVLRTGSRVRLRDAIGLTS
ncbi:ABC-2 type transport system permease protein [Actinocrispum wychmicini]|uniref:ABC-2 type transport system permease protein n=2 Tax=Actinocrispum wychmicini TaxID=1213861 RepID=A0A4R2JM88_9PSEU|nr:ABC-2 type transport system permease protein [Actinocrispum wychmicini]